MGGYRLCHGARSPLQVSAKFKPYKGTARVICLDIPDEYEFMDPDLIRLLKAKVSRHLPSV